jgi:hypothetical protein
MPAMPIPDDELHKPLNSYIAVSAEAKAGQAVAALLASGGQQWWKLLVRKQDGTWVGTSFGNLYQSISQTQNASHLNLIECSALSPIPSLESGRTDIEKATLAALRSPAAFVAIVKGSELIGVIVSPKRDAAKPFSAGQMTELAGQYIDLSLYGAILLSSSPAASSEIKK